MSFQTRLRFCMDRGNLTIADLARWLERPHATVSTWIQEGREPRGPDATIRWLDAQLGRLESAIRDTTGFPVPHNLSDTARTIYIKRIKERIDYPTRSVRSKKLARRAP
jgi:hypothetical protein